MAGVALSVHSVIAACSQSRRADEGVPMRISYNGLFCGAGIALKFAGGRVSMSPYHGPVLVNSLSRLQSIC